MTLNKKIVWAVDPFSEESPLVKKTAQAIAVLAAQWQADVEPVYLLGDLLPNIRLLPDLVRDLQAQAQRDFKHLLQGVAIPDFKEIHFITEPASQLRAQVDHLIDYAKTQDADVIAVGTRARKGLARWVLGSFAETLILRSDVPLFVINPKESSQSKYEHILFPSDFSEESRMAFNQVLEIASKMKAQVTLFHKIKYALTPSAELAFSTYSAYKDLFQQDVETQQREAAQWESVAKASGVEIESVIDYSMKGSVADSILQRSKSRGGMIAMAAHSGPVTSTLLGSVSRQVIRNAECPVWVVHIEQQSEAGPVRIPA